MTLQIIPDCVINSDEYSAWDPPLHMVLLWWSGVRVFVNNRESENERERLGSEKWRRVIFLDESSSRPLSLSVSLSLSQSWALSPVNGVGWRTGKWKMCYSRWTQWEKLKQLWKFWQVTFKLSLLKIFSSASYQLGLHIMFCHGIRYREAT